MGTGEHGCPRIRLVPCLSLSERPSLGGRTLMNAEGGGQDECLVEGERERLSSDADAAVALTPELLSERRAQSFR